MVGDLLYNPDELLAFITTASPVSPLMPYLPFNKLVW